MIYLHAISLVNALGSDRTRILQNWQTGTSPGLTETDSWLVGKIPAVFGCVKEPLPDLSERFPRENTRNNRLLALAWENEKDRFSALLSRHQPDRVAVVLGTSTSGSDEAAHFVKTRVSGGDDPNYDAVSQEFGNPSEFLRRYIGITGPSYTISTACTSSTRAIISGARLIDAGLVDAALVGGADTLAQSAVNGFNSLQALSPRLCKPFAENRAGITIGEGAGLLWLDKNPAPIFLAGYGESSDAYHISSPDPEGSGAEVAIREALQRALLSPSDIDYINAHGTATPLNDSAEAKALNRVFGNSVPVTSTKNLTGHTLGAAGITDAGLSYLLLENGPTTICGQFFGNDTIDSALPEVGILRQAATLDATFVMSNNFAFGGNNASVIFGKRQ